MCDQISRFENVLSQMSNFHQLEVVGSRSETQIQVSEFFFKFRISRV